MGTDQNNKLKLATDYIKFLGTIEFTPAEIQQEFYKLGCDLTVNSGSDKVQVTLSGLPVSYTHLRAHET